MTLYSTELLKFIDNNVMIFKSVKEKIVTNHTKRFDSVNSLTI